MTHFFVLVIDLGSSLAAKKIGLVYGGGTIGLMGAVANGVIGGGGDIVGVVPEFFEGNIIELRIDSVELIWPN